jgi:hypothetical protein
MRRSASKVATVWNLHSNSPPFVSMPSISMVESTE